MTRRDSIQETLEQLATLPEEEDCMPLLHDVHPHNTFFLGDSCALIYDYEQVALYSHGDALAFSIHRFVRERVRNLRRHGDVRDNELPGYIARTIDLFLTEYAREGPSLPSDIKQTMSLRIVKQSLIKLRYCMAAQITPHSNLAHVEREYLNAEVRKFLTCLDEAKYFRAGAS